MLSGWVPIILSFPGIVLLEAAHFSLFPFDQVQSPPSLLNLALGNASLGGFFLSCPGHRPL